MCALDRVHALGCKAEVKGYKMMRAERVYAS